MESNQSSEWQAWFASICEEFAVSERKAGRFEPKPDDAFKLAALQWWTHEIGRILIEVYATDRRQYDRIAKILSDATLALKSLAGQQRLSAVSGDTFCSVDPDCPDGFYCDEGTCEPIGGGVVTPSSTSSAS